MVVSVMDDVLLNVDIGEVADAPGPIVMTA
jgi:hypothetical protein